MFAFLLAYLCIPERFRFLARWFAAIFVLVVVALVVVLFARILLTLPSDPKTISRPKISLAKPIHKTFRLPAVNLSPRRIGDY